MPELPEVETVKRGLEKLIIGKQISKVASDNPKSFPNDPNIVEEFLIGSNVVRIRRRAKVLLIDLSTDYTLMIHLRMTGQVVYVGENRFGAGHPNDSLVNKLPDNSTRVIFTFSDKTHMYFNDQRKFGWVKLVPTGLVHEDSFMQKVGPEPLEKSFTPEVFITRISKRKGATVKAALLDQTVLAGIGNIYADEALWASRIHPAIRVHELTKQQLNVLHGEIIKVLKLSIDKGGSTDKNYVNAEGKRGSYIDFAKVFRREGLECYECGTEIEKSRVAGRGTHTCIVCQPYER